MNHRLECRCLSVFLSVAALSAVHPDGKFAWVHFEHPDRGTPTGYPCLVQAPLPRGDHRGFARQKSPPHWVWSKVPGKCSINQMYFYTWKLYSSSPVRYLKPIKQHFVLTSWTFLMDLAFACFTIELTRVLMCCLTYENVAKSRVMPIFWWAAVKIFTLLSHFFCNDTKRLFR